LEIGRGNRSVQFDLRYRRQPPLVPRRLRFEIEERIGGHGEIITPLNPKSLLALVPQLRAAKVQAVAISFLNAYRNPIHEVQARDLLREAMPEVYITIGTDLSREWAEYERTSTAAANAFVGADMAEYIGNFENKLKKQDFPGRVYMMGSNGGVMSTEQAMALPIAMVESGPVGGCIGAGEYAAALGIDRMIAFDMGGTTAKCALVENGRFEVESTYYVGGYDYGFPLRTPVLDIVEVGAGGGSIAWIDENGRLKVGPRSAGSTPGPIAFQRGGKEPTVTDANVVLGRIGSDSFMNGKLRLDVASASAAIETTLAQRLGFSGPDGVDHVAQGILDIATVTMTGAIKQISTQRGRDVREYDLFVFGGGGPLFGSELARSLRIRSVIVPPNPGAFSSFGMLMAEARRDAARTFHKMLSAASTADLAGELRAMENDLRQEMAAEFNTERLTFGRFAEMRYRGQAHTVRVVLPEGHSVASIQEAFEATYANRYGHTNEGFPIEYLILHVVARVPTQRPTLADLGPRNGAALARPLSKRPVYYSSVRKRIDTPVYRRRDLPKGFSLTGPAIVEEYSSTTIVGIGDRLEVGALGELRIRWNAPEEH
jgi:N-methylhydantoinase A